MMCFLGDTEFLICRGHFVTPPPGRNRVKTKYYKTGENKKLSSRRKGKWTIVDKLLNGANFRIENYSTNNKKVVHHNRLTPLGLMPL